MESMAVDFNMIHLDSGVKPDDLMLDIITLLDSCPITINIYVIYYV